MNSVRPRGLLLLALIAMLVVGCGYSCPSSNPASANGCIVTCADLPGDFRCVTDGRTFTDGSSDAHDERTMTVDVVDVSTDRSAPDGGDASVAIDASDASNIDSDAADATTDATTDAGPTIDPMVLAPRALSPLSTATVSSTRPTLRWQNGATIDGAVVELSRTRDFAAIAITQSVTSDRWRVSTPLGSGVWFWRLRGRVSTRDAEGSSPSAVWSFRVGSQNAPIDTSSGSELDLNGDGFADVAIGAPKAEGGRGKVDVYYGSATGLAAMPAVTLRGVANGDDFGVAVTSAGDLNGDGFADLLVGSSWADPGGRMNAGTANVFYGSSSGISATPSLVLEGRNPGDFFSWSIAGAGDVNGDGFGDIAVGAYWADPGGRMDAGSVSVFHGGPTGLNTTAALVLEGSAAGDGFGWDSAGVGDVNGDGFADLVVGVPAADPGARMSAGSASVFLGSPTGITSTAARVIDGAAATDSFGISVSAAGDVNGDGYSDVLIGANLADPGGRMDAGTVSVFLGSSTGIAAVPARVLEGLAPGDLFGWSTSGAGDVDMDGFDDILVGAHFADPSALAEAGQAYLFRGGVSVVSSAPLRTMGGVAAGDYFGVSLSGAGDVNGDGRLDFIVGASLANPGGRMDAGTASLFLNAAGGFSTTPTRVFEGQNAGDFLGVSVASLRRSRPSATRCLPRSPRSRVRSLL